jgi:O-antigen/teichoic acid export membrane protein
MNELSPYRRLVTYAEKVTHTDLEYLFTNGFWLTLAQIGIALIAFVLSIAFAHFVTKDTYGTYRYLLSIFWTLTAFSLTGLPVAMARAVARGEDGAYVESFWLSMIWSWPMVLISLGLAGYYYLQGNHLLMIGAIIIAIIGPFMQSTYLFGAFFEGKRAFRANAIAGIILNVVPALALIGAMFLTQDPLIYLAVYLVGNAGTAGVISLVAYFKYKTNSIKSEKLFTLGGHFSIMNILSTIASQVDRLLVYHYLGAAELAIYVFATAMPDQVKNIFNNVTTLAFPKFANRSLKEIHETLLFRLAGFTGIMTIVAIAYIVVAPLAFHILFPAYASSIGYSQLYALALIPIGNMIPTTALQAHAANRELYIFNILSSLVQIGLLFPAIALYGLLGAVIARIISRTFNLALAQGMLEYRMTRSEGTA